MTIDVETRGVESWLETTAVVGVGVSILTRSDEVKWIYIDTHPERASEGGRKLVFSRLFRVMGECTGHVIGYNILFDMSMLYMENLRFGIHDDTEYPAFTHDVFTLYKSLSSEGWPGQSWSLKSAMVDVLGWGDTNEREVDEWLVNNGYVKGRGAGGVSPNKEEMHRVPPDILGKYCVLDCYATLKLYTDVLRPVLDDFPRFEEYHTMFYVPVLQETARQQHVGIRVDRNGLLLLKETIQAELRHYDSEVRSHPVLSEIVARFEQRFIDEHKKEEPPKFKVRKATKEPVKFTKAGELTKSWIRWNEKARMEPDLTVRWKKWDHKLQQLLNGEVEKCRFNLASGDHLRHLLYESGVVKVEPGSPPHPDGSKPGSFFLYGKNGRVEIELTNSGAYPTDSEALEQMPDDIVKPILGYKEAAKELSYVEAYLELLVYHPDSDSWRLHAGWIPHGTLTGRFSGKNPSLHQVPKSLRFLECMVADPHTAWVEMDWTALEPHVLAELSRDKALLDLYGPNAKTHDRYLYTIANLPHPIAENVKKYYDVNNPSKEGISKAKKECKKERELGKVLVLAGDYGASAVRKWRACQVRGINISLKDMEKIHALQLELHRGVFGVFQNDLRYEWQQRGGWVLSGLGFPTPVYVDYVKDLINRVVQRTGHDCHVIFLGLFIARLRKLGLPFVGIVLDFHDQFIIQVPEVFAEEVRELASECVVELNELLGGYVKLKGEPRIVRGGMAEAKMEEEYMSRKRNT